MVDGGVPSDGTVSRSAMKLRLTSLLMLLALNSSTTGWAQQSMLPASASSISDDGSHFSQRNLPLPGQRDTGFDLRAQIELLERLNDFSKRQPDESDPTPLTESQLKQIDSIVNSFRDQDGNLSLPMLDSLPKPWIQSLLNDPVKRQQARQMLEQYARQRQLPQFRELADKVQSLGTGQTTDNRDSSTDQRRMPRTSGAPTDLSPDTKTATNNRLNRDQANPDEPTSSDRSRNNVSSNDRNASDPSENGPTSLARPNANDSSTADASSSGADKQAVQQLLEKLLSVEQSRRNQESTSKSNRSASAPSRPSTNKNKAAASSGGSQWLSNSDSLRRNPSRPTGSDNRKLHPSWNPPPGSMPRTNPLFPSLEDIAQSNTTNDAGTPSNTDANSAAKDTTPMQHWLEEASVRTR